MAHNNIRSIVVVGRKWFDKVNGNTYHGGTVYVDGVAYPIPYQYGYGNQYVDSACDVLEAKGLIELERYPSGIRQGLFEYCYKRNIQFAAEACNVARKRDIKD